MEKLSLKLRQAVSLEKRRYKDAQFDLDLSYITPSIIAMGLPSFGIEAAYRNKAEDVRRFLLSKHGPNFFLVYNLCKEPHRKYDKSLFDGRVVSHFCWADHQAPTPLLLLFELCHHATEFLKRHPNNIVAIHCKAGKGRTGVAVCALMLWQRVWASARSSLAYFGRMRTQDGNGVTIASQRRYIRYFDLLMHRILHDVRMQEEKEEEEERIGDRANGGDDDDDDDDDDNEELELSRIFDDATASTDYINDVDDSLLLSPRHASEVVLKATHHRRLPQSADARHLSLLRRLLELPLAPLQLQYILLYPVPLSLQKSLSFQIVLGDNTVLYESNVSNKSTAPSNDALAYAMHSFPLDGDVCLQFYKNNGDSLLFRLWLNLRFVDSKVVLFPRSELDHCDKSLTDEFRLQLHFLNVNQSYHINSNERAMDVNSDCSRYEPMEVARARLQSTVKLHDALLVESSFKLQSIIHGHVSLLIPLDDVVGSGSSSSHGGGNSDNVSSNGQQLLSTTMYAALLCDKTDISNDDDDDQQQHDVIFVIGARSLVQDELFVLRPSRQLQLYNGTYAATSLVVGDCSFEVTGVDVESRQHQAVAVAVADSAARRRWLDALAACGVSERQSGDGTRISAGANLKAMIRRQQTCQKCRSNPISARVIINTSRAETLLLCKACALKINDKDE